MPCFYIIPRFRTQQVPLRTNMSPCAVALWLRIDDLLQLFNLLAPVLVSIYSIPCIIESNSVKYSADERA